MMINFTTVSMGWLGRAADVLFGKPVEGWPKKDDDYLEEMGIEQLVDLYPVP